MRNLRLHVFFALFAALFLAAGLPPEALAEVGSLIKGSTPAVYYIDEGKRYVFPNENVYFSWYADFSQVRAVTDDELASYPIGGNVTYKPGARLVKLQSDPRVFAVGAGGTLRWIASEGAARALYGDDWNKKVDDLPDAFFFAYKEGEAVASAADFDKTSEREESSIADDLAAKTGTPASQDFAAVRSGSWSDAEVWNGSRPTAGARVTIPVGTSVVYDMADGPTMKSIDVSGSLSFATDRSARLAARQITVRGTLSAGSAAAPLPADKRIEIALTGAADTAVADDGLTIDGGTLALYGADVGAAWTRLASPAEIGATKLSLEAAEAWPVGGQIAILGATTAEEEVRQIKSVDGATITLDRPLERAHRSEDGLRSEVALLSRNIVIDGVGEGRGSYARGINHAKIVVQDVELASLGRKGASGQSPLMLDGLSGATVAGDAIHDSGNRCVTLRQATGVTIRNTVAFRAYGHCFATEDGSEIGNVFVDDLAADIRPGALPSDAAPAAFLLKHPGNRVEGNAAVGATFGYWYLLTDHATTNAGVELHPREAALGSFDQNVARANAKVGLYVDDGAGKGDFIPASKASFTGLTSVMNGERGFWIRGVNLEVSGAFLAENLIGGSFAAFGATLKDSTIAGRLEGSTAPAVKAAYGFTFDDGPVSVQNVTFAHFKKGASAFGFEEKNAELPDPRNSEKGIILNDADAWHAPNPVTPGDAMAAVRDLDQGDVVGPRSAFLGADCKAADGNVERCPGPYAQLEIALRDGKGDKSVTFTELGTNASVTLSPGPAFDGQYAYATVAEGGRYRANVLDAASVEASYDGLAKPLLVRVPAGLGASVRSDGQTLQKTELAALAPGGWAYDGGSAEAVLWLNPGDDFELTR